MKLLIIIQSDSELICYEAFALAFLLASFDHKIQLYVCTDSLTVLNDPSTRAHGMISSLELYDLPIAWTSHPILTDGAAINDTIRPMLSYIPNDIDMVIRNYLDQKNQNHAKPILDFDSVLIF